MTRINNIAHKNLQVLLQKDGGAADCYKKPLECSQIWANMEKLMQDVEIPKEFHCFEYHYPAAFPV
jgi:hypothetical protein